MAEDDYEDDEVPMGGSPVDAPGSSPADLAGGPGGLGGMDMGDLLASAQEAMSAQADAAEATVEGSAGGGVVRVTMSGTGEVTRVEIAPEVVEPDDVEMLQDLIVAAFSDAANQVTALQRQALGALGQIDLSNLGGGLGRLFGDAEPEG